MFLCSLMSFAGQATHSQCQGTVSQGTLKSGIQLPYQGNNYRAYSKLGYQLGRTYVHTVVHEAMIVSYARLYEIVPQAKFTFGETGFQQGGSFQPHRTHQNGLSVDFFVPVRNAQGHSVYFPGLLSNKAGYAVEFDHQGHSEKYVIDFELMALHLKILDQVIREKGYGIKKVIFDPVLQKQLWGTKSGAYLKENISFSKNRVWVRHDEHYHIDFDVPCID